MTMSSDTNIWKKDLLNRQKEGKYLVNYLIKRYQTNPNSPFVLNINAEWGFGKTYFLENLAKEFETKKHPVVYFDAWKNDFTNNPLLAFISELDKTLNEYFYGAPKAKLYFKSAYQISKNILLPILAKKITGHALEELYELLESKEIVNKDNSDSDLENGVSSIVSKVAELSLSEHRTIQQSIDDFKNQMQKLLKHIDKNMDAKSLPMFILIDELDRCRPNYAIELLENIKHIFDIPGIIFIVATDSKQLSHSINAVYGDNFASERYLKRFFNQEYNLANPDNYDYAVNLFNERRLLASPKFFSPLDRELYDGLDLSASLFAIFSSFFKLSYRDQEQAIDMLNSIALVWDNTEKIHLPYLLFLIMLKQKHNESFIHFIELYIAKKSSSIEQDFLAILDIDMTVSFKDYKRNQHAGIEEVSLGVPSLINLYIGLFNITHASFEKKHHSKTPNSNLERKILTEFYQQIKGYPDASFIVTRGLDKYPNLILQAGHFS